MIPAVAGRSKREVGSSVRIAEVMAVCDSNWSVDAGPGGQAGHLAGMDSGREVCVDGVLPGTGGVRHKADLVSVAAVVEAVNCDAAIAEAEGR